MNSERNCKTQLFPTTLLPKPEYLRDGYWAISTAEEFKISISCLRPSKEAVIVKTPVTIFHLNESCMATSKYFIIPARNTFQSKITIQNIPIHISPVKIANTSLWKPIQKRFLNNSAVKVPSALESLESFPMSKLLSELDNVGNQGVEMNRTTAWYWYLIGTLFGLMIIIIILFYNRDRVHKYISQMSSRKIVETPAEQQNERSVKIKSDNILFLKGSDITGSTVVTA